MKKPRLSLKMRLKKFKEREAREKLVTEVTDAVIKKLKTEEGSAPEIPSHKNLQ